MFRYKFVTGSGTDECALWLNPVTGQADEAGAGVFAHHHRFGFRSKFTFIRAPA